MLSLNLFVAVNDFGLSLSGNDNIYHAKKVLLTF